VALLLRRPEVVPESEAVVVLAVLLLARWPEDIRLFRVDLLELFLKFPEFRRWPAGRSQ